MKENHGESSGNFCEEFGVKRERGNNRRGKT